jgi:putative Mn2+ efflux pump MntP
MKLWEILLLAVALSMDAFAVSICKGLAMKKVTAKGACTVGLWFGSFQLLMPLLGYFLANQFAAAIEAFDHWIAFGLLAIIGINMVREALSKESEEISADLSVKTMFLMAVATSIDAMAAGISLSAAGLPVSGGASNIFVAVGLIGCTTFLLSASGVKAGNTFGAKYEKKAELAGGIVLVLLGVKILLEHLGVL